MTEHDDQVPTEAATLRAENERLRAALDAVRDNPHGHPTAGDGMPAPPELCSVCSFVELTLDPRL